MLFTQRGNGGLASARGGDRRQLDNVLTESRMCIEHRRRAQPIRSICYPVKDGNIGSERISCASLVAQGAGSCPSARAS
jgi:hypothetical protein